MTTCASAGGDDPRAGGGDRPADRHSGRPARAEAAASACSPTAEAELHKGDAFTLDADPTPGDATRVQLPHPEILSSLAPGHRVLIDDGKVMLRVAEAEPTRSVTVVEVAGTSLQQEGRQPARHDHPDLGDDRQGSLRPRRRRSRRTSTGSRSPSSSGRRTWSRSRRSPTAARWSWPRSRSRRRRPARRDHGGRRRLDGGARRPRRRDAARAGARHPEDADPHRAQARQAGGRGDPDAGIDDHFARADPRRGLRRRDRGV